MDWKNLFLSFEGRINRQPYWLGTIALLVGAFVVYFILQIFMGGSMFGDPTKMLEPGFMEGYMKTVSWRQLIMLAIIGYPATALMVKRLNDRDRPFLVAKCAQYCAWYFGPQLHIRRYGQRHAIADTYKFRNDPFCSYARHRFMVTHRTWNLARHRWTEPLWGRSAGLIEYLLPFSP
jgi:uncharacterized membrane protein YhaH (DUF805 family)